MIVEQKEISKAVISRLPRYYRYLGELMEEGVERAVCDYIAGMTDVYAVECFNAAFIPKSWSVK